MPTVCCFRAAKSVLLPVPSELQGFGVFLVFKIFYTEKCWCLCTSLLWNRCGKWDNQRVYRNVKLVLTVLFLSVNLRIPCRHQSLKIQAMLYSSSFFTSILKGYLEIFDVGYFGIWEKFYCGKTFHFTWNFTVLLKIKHLDISLLVSPHAFINKSL